MFCCEALDARQMLSATADVDLSFNGTGTASTHVPYPDYSVPIGAIQQSDGKLVTAVNTATHGLIRWNTDGSRDLSFGDHGCLTNPAFLWMDKIGIQGDGKLVVASTDFRANNTIRLVRLTPEGAQDPTFGTGGISDVTLANFPYPDGTSVTGIQFDSAGRILLNVALDFGTSTFYVVRLLPNGSLDTSFSGDGLATVTLGTTQRAGGPLLLQGSKIIAISGTTAVRFNVDGSQDMTFGEPATSSLARPSPAESMRASTLDSSGRILVTGAAISGTSAVVARYTADGRLDTTFANNGVLSFSMYTSNVVRSTPTAIGIDTTGKIVIGGQVGTSRNQLAFTRLTAAGSLDPTFDTDGRALFNIDVDNGARCSYLLLDSSNRISAVGVNNDTYNGDMLLVRVTSGGALDATFDGDGTTIFKGTLDGDDIDVAAAQTSDGKTLVLSRFGESYYAYSGLTRFNSDGTIDESFGINGSVTLTGWGNGLAMDGDQPLVLAAGYIYRLTPNGALDTAFSGDGILQISGSREHIAVDHQHRVYVSDLGALTRFTATGNLDKTFDGDGTFNVTNPGIVSTGLCISPDNSILMSTGGFLWRILPSAAPDTTFGNNGSVSVGAISTFAEGADGSIFTGNSTQPAMTVRKYSRFGVADVTYGANGAASADTASGTTEAVRSIAIYADGTAVVKGQVFGALQQAVLVQFTPTGQLDPTFDGDGFLRFPSSGVQHDQQAILDAEGRILVIGQVVKWEGTQYQNRDTTLTRFAGRTETIAPTVIQSSLSPAIDTLRLVIGFSENIVPAIPPSALSVQLAGDDAVTHPRNASYDPRTFSSTFFFDHTLANGNYIATLASETISDAAGNKLTVGPPITFFILASDGDQNRRVDINDFNLLAANFGKPGKTFAEGNYDYSADGKITIEDFNILAANFGKHVDPPAGFGQTIAQAKTASFSEMTLTGVKQGWLNQEIEDTNLLSDIGLV